ncbi:MAG: EpsG family protein [Clostridiales bacterium]|nr:EpsG family protein [Clostridiales bacterium]
MELVINRYMAIFATIVIITYVMAIMGKTYGRGKRGGIGQPKPNFIVGYAIPVIIFSIFSGLRNTIGDTDAYIWSYELLTYEEAAETKLQIKGGMMLDFLQAVAKRNGLDFQVILIFGAFLSCMGALYVIYEYACPYELGVVLFVLTGYYTFSMNGLRQYMASGILMLGVKYFLSTKRIDFFKFLIFVFIAWTFHSTAIVMIPIYFIIRRKSWSLSTILLLVGTVGVTLMANALLPALFNVLEDTSYEHYATGGWFTSGEEAGSNIIRIFVLIVPLVLAYLYREKLAVLGRLGNIVVNISIINLCFYIVSLYNWIFARFAVYTSVYAIVLITWLVSFGFDRDQERAIYWGGLGLYSVYFYFLAYTVNIYSSNYF